MLAMIANACNDCECLQWLWMIAMMANACNDCECLQRLWMLAKIAFAIFTGICHHSYTLHSLLHILATWLPSLGEEWEEWENSKLTRSLTAYGRRCRTARCFAAAEKELLKMSGNLKPCKHLQPLQVFAIIILQAFAIMASIWDHFEHLVNLQSF